MTHSATRLALAQRATLATLLAEAIVEYFDREDPDHAAWIEDACKTLTAVAEEMSYDDLVQDGTFTTLPMLLATEEGWCLIKSGLRGVEIQKDDDSETFDSDERAVAFVKRRADEGSKLHAIALAIHNKDGRS